MQWSCLGHAGWLVEAAGLRLLIDPLLTAQHQRGLLTTNPPRALREGALRPDFLLISHAHPDHFDVPSLRTLARLDPDTVVLTPDALVARTARTLGFHAVERIEPDRRVDLDGVRLLTTPSLSPDEWGVLVEHEGVVGWHLVDTVLSAAEVVAVLERAARSLALPRLPRHGPDLALVRYQPLLEGALALGDRLAFPLDDYAALLEVAAALGDATIVPSSSGSIHAGLHAAMNTLVYPQTEAGFLRDVRARSARLRALPSALGGLYRVTHEGVALDPDGASDLIAHRSPPLPTPFRPFAPPPLVDPRPASPGLARRLDRWVREALGPALASALPALPPRPWSLVLEIVYPAGLAACPAYTLRASAGGFTLDQSFDDEHHLLNSVTASMLDDVIAGRASWADALQSGQLRASRRDHVVTARGTERGRADVLFVTHAIPFDASVARASSMN